MLEKIKNIIEDISITIEAMFDEKLAFIKNFPYIIKTNIELLWFFNTRKCYFHWDYDFLYSLIVWKIKKMRKTLKEEDIIANVDEICDQMSKAIHAWEVFQDPNTEVEMPKWLDNKFNKAVDDGDYTNLFNRDNLNIRQKYEEKEYYTKLNEVQEKAWNEFHDTLKKYGRGWWS